MIKRMTNGLVKFVSRYLPNPYVFAIILTVIVYFLGLTMTTAGPIQMVDYWYKGIFALLKFTMQMILVLVTGYALARAPIVEKYLRRFARIPKSPVQAVIFTGIIAYFSGYLSWGFGLIAGALVAKEVAIVNEGKGIHFPILVAAAYSGNIVRGPSSSIPLSVATKGHFLEKSIGIIPASETLLSGWNIAMTVAILLVIVVLYAKMTPKKGELIIEADVEKLKASISDSTDNKVESKNLNDKLNNSKFLAFLIASAGLFVIVKHFAIKGFDLNLNIMIFIFMIFGMFGHLTPIGYVRAVNEAIKVAGGVALLFPFYAGIMGMMRDSGLAAIISTWFVSISDAKTFPLVTFLSAGFVNLFVPSGGGQWAVQGPIMMPAAVELGADLPKTIMALAWGDSWTNQIQPFWALPILAISGLDVKDIMGYCLMFSILAGLVISGFLLFV